MDSRRSTILKPFIEHADFMNERVAAGIEAHRKGDLSLQLTDAAGRPLSGAKVSLRQTGHAFLYGASLFMLDEFDTPEENEAYRDAFATDCNLATLPFYWSANEPQEGKTRYHLDAPPMYRRPNIDLCLDYTAQRGITPKAHCLNYDGNKPKWVGVETAPVKRLLEKRYRELSDLYRDRIHCWEVTNETLCAPGNNSTKFFMDPDFVEWSFEMAERYFPDNQLLINECHANLYEPFRENRSQYYMLIERAIRNGARIDGIGVQFHMFYKREDEARRTAGIYDPRFMYAFLDRYADFGLPLQVTEITIPAYGDDAENEAIQAEIVRHMYAMWFSHPGMEAIVYWNLVDGYAYTDTREERRDMTRGENVYYGGLLRPDLTPKPAMEVIHDLFARQWRTNLDCTADETGCVRTRGFYGTYDVRVDGKTQQIRLDKGGDAMITVSFGGE